MTVYDASGLRSTFNSSVCLLDYQPPEPDSPATTFDGIDLGNAEFYYLKNPTFLRGWRSKEHIQVDRVDDFLICMPINSERHTSQACRNATVEPGDFVLLSTAQPFASQCVSASHAEYVLKVSGAMLRQRVPNIDDFCSRSLKIRPGAGKILHKLCELALSEGKLLSGGYARQFGTMVIDSLANVALTAPELEPLHIQLKQPAHQRIHHRAMEYIEYHLSDPALTILEIAKHCNVSLRSLNLAFAAAGTTVSSHIRESRLQRCREALRNPALRNKLVIEIAMQWGFNDAAHFCHAYKARFGKTPTGERGTKSGPDDFRGDEPQASPIKVGANQMTA